MTLRALHDLSAPAKLNRFLHVVGRRPDGYHLLESVFVLIDWADTLHLERREDGLLRRHDLGPALPADDLCLRAARALQQASGCALGADISIDKQVPWGAGMGGGSSDAATTLLGLNRLWGLNWSRPQLMALGLKLGADVPFFLGGHPALVQGIGETLTPMRLAPERYAVVKPPQAIHTRDIFEHPLLTRDSKTVIVTGSLDSTGFFGWPAEWKAKLVSGAEEDFGQNDLQAPAQDRCPEVAQAAHWLKARYGNSRMTGSGSAVFARVETNTKFDSGTSASPMATFPAEELPPGWVGRMCRSLQAHPLVGWATD
jgi:4-diphosphocytidyl-2-C-methyl-D-erythritol kinase